MTTIPKNNITSIATQFIDVWKTLDKTNNSILFVKPILSIPLEKYTISYKDKILFTCKSLNEFLIKSDKYIQTNKTIQKLFIGSQSILQTNHSKYSYLISVNGKCGFYPTDFSNILETDNMIIELCDICIIKSYYPSLGWIDSIFDTDVSSAGIEYMFRYLKVELNTKIQN